MNVVRVRDLYEMIAPGIASSPCEFAYVTYRPSQSKKPNLFTSAFLFPLSIPMRLESDSIQFPLCTFCFDGRLIQNILSYRSRSSQKSSQITHQAFPSSGVTRLLLRFT